jgi:hypothetical protein
MSYFYFIFSAVCPKFSGRSENFFCVGLKGLSVRDREGEKQRAKLKLTGGDHRLAQVLVRQEVFSIQIK